MSEFAGRVLLVTGAGGGIGQAIAASFHEAGARVVLADIRRDAMEGVAKSLDPSAERVECVSYDASRPGDADVAVKRCFDRFGGLDFLVPAAALYEELPFMSMTDDQWRRSLAVNLDGVFYICRRAIPVMKEGSSVVTIASQSAHVGASKSHSPYGASKGGVLALTLSLARELAPRIRVNTVSPGVIDTPMAQELLRRHGTAVLDTIPLGRQGMPREVADAVMFSLQRRSNLHNRAGHPCKRRSVHGRMRDPAIVRAVLTGSVIRFNIESTNFYVEALTMERRGLTDEQVQDFARSGILFPVRVLDGAEAAALLRELEEIERAEGGQLSKRTNRKPHLLLTSLAALVRDARILDAVEDLIGPQHTLLGI